MQTSHERFDRIKKIGAQTKFTQDLYHRLLTSTWRQFFLFYFICFIVFNLIFAVFYWEVPCSFSGGDESFFHAFAFSVQTFSTVGYGVFAPRSDTAHTLVTIESSLSVFVTALLTGLIFSKFSRPSARIVFSRNILINDFDGKRTLSFRMGNLRANQIAEAEVRVVLLMAFQTAEGQNIRRQVDLKLVRSSSLFFALTWSVMHTIDETSPLYNLTSKDLLEKNIELGVSIMGYDSTFSQSIHASCIYAPEDFIFDRYFEDVFDFQDGRVVSLNYSKFHALKG